MRTSFLTAAIFLLATMSFAVQGCGSTKENKIQFFPPSGTTVQCPSSSEQNSTGYVTFSDKYDDIITPETTLGSANKKGFAKFDISSVQAGATITKVQIFLYVKEVRVVFQQMAACHLDFDPVTATATEICTGFNGFLSQNIPASTVGWTSFEISSTALADFVNAIPTGYYAIKMYGC